MGSKFSKLAIKESKEELNPYSDIPQVLLTETDEEPVVTPNDTIHITKIKRPWYLFNRKNSTTPTSPITPLSPPTTTDFSISNTPTAISPPSIDENNNIIKEFNHVYISDTTNGIGGNITTIMPISTIDFQEETKSNLISKSIKNIPPPPRKPHYTSKHRDLYNPRLRNWAPPVYINRGGSSGLNRNRQCISPTDRLKHVDIIEELCYYCQGDVQPEQSYDYYNHCEECGELEFIAEGPTYPGEIINNPITYSKKQRFHFNSIQDKNEDNNDGPPFIWTKDIQNCYCKCCTSGSRGKDPKCQCNCCCNGKARRINPYDEIPVGQNTCITEDIVSTVDLHNSRCINIIPKESGIYYFDAEQKCFIPHDPEPEVIIEEIPPPLPPRKKRFEPTTIMQPIIQPMNMNPYCGPCGPMDIGGMGMGMGGMGMGMGGMGMNGMGMGGMGMNGMGMGMGGNGMGMGMNGMGMGGNGIPGMHMGGMPGVPGMGCCPPGCTLPIVMMPNCQQSTQPTTLPIKIKKDKKKKKKKRKKSEMSETIIDFETEPSLTTTYGYIPATVIPEIITIGSPIVIINQQDSFEDLQLPEETIIKNETKSIIIINNSDGSQQISSASATATTFGGPSRGLLTIDESITSFQPTPAITPYTPPIITNVTEYPSETITTVMIPPGIDGDVLIGQPIGNLEYDINIDPPINQSIADQIDITVITPETRNHIEVDLIHDEEEEEVVEEEEEDYIPLVGSQTFQFQVEKENFIPPRTS